MRDNLTVNLGLRYEFNQHMHDVDNRLSSVDLAVPGGRFVIASDENGADQPDAQALLPLIPIPYVTSAEAGWGRGLLDPSAVRLAPRTGLRARARRRPRRRSRRLRHLPQSVGLQRADRVRAQPAVLLHASRSTCRPTSRSPTLQTRNILTSDPTGAVGAQHHGPRLRRRVHARRGAAACSTQLSPSTMAEVVYMGIVDARRRQRDDPQRARARARVRFRRGGRFRSSSRINAIRFDGKSIYHGMTLKAERRLRRRLRLQRQLHALARRKTMPRARERRSRKPTCRRTCATSSTRPASGRARASTIGISSSPAARISCRSSRVRGACTERCCGGWRVNAIFTAQSGAPFTVNLGVDRANIGAGPAQRPDQIRDPNLPGGRADARIAGSTPSAFALPAPFTFGSAPRNSVIGPGFANVDLALAKTWSLAGASQLEFRWEVFNLLNRANFDSAEPNLRHAQLRPHLQREEPAGDAVRPSAGVLISRGDFVSTRCARLRASSASSSVGGGLSNSGHVRGEPARVGVAC